MEKSIKVLFYKALAQIKLYRSYAIALPIIS